MSTVAEIEDAIGKLPAAKQRVLLRHLNARLGVEQPAGARVKGRRWPVPPPKVSKAESKRVARRIEREFGRVEVENWN